MRCPWCACHGAFRACLYQKCTIIDNNVCETNPPRADQYSAGDYIFIKPWQTYGLMAHLNLPFVELLFAISDVQAKVLHTKDKFLVWICRYDEGCLMIVATCVKMIITLNMELQCVGMTTIETQRMQQLLVNLSTKPHSFLMLCI